MMMMQQQKPTVDVPPWSAGIHRGGQHMPASGVSSASNLLLTEAALAALDQYFPLTPNDGYEEDEGIEEEEEMMESAAAVDAYSCDEFRMYEFKIRRCVRGRSHDWTECPYAHPGEKARRRDPRKYHYSGTACPDFRKGNCKRGDACEYAHGVFECWLHPARYRTQPCKDGTSCRRRVCFFAHTPDQLRVLPQSPKAMESYDGSPLRQQQQFMTPPLSPSASESTMGDVIASMRKLQLGKVMSMPAAGSQTWVGFARSVGGGGGFCSLPSTPTRNGSGTNSRFGIGRSNGLGLEEEEEVVEVAEERRVESGRALRAKLYEKLSKDAMVGPDFGWVSELVK